MMLFEKLIKQQRVDRFVTDSIRLALAIAYHQIGIYPFHIFGYESKTLSAVRIDLLFVSEFNRLKGEEGFAGSIDRAMSSL